MSDVVNEAEVTKDDIVSFPTVDDVPIDASKDDIITIIGRDLIIPSHKWIHCGNAHRISNHAIGIVAGVEDIDDVVPEVSLRTERMHLVGIGVGLAVERQCVLGQHRDIDSGADHTGLRVRRSIGHGAQRRDDRGGRGGLA